MIKMEKRKFKVFTWKLANQLNNLGFRPLGKELNRKDPTREVILFEDTPELRAAIKNLTAK